MKKITFKIHSKLNLFLGVFNVAVGTAFFNWLSILNFLVAVWCFADAFVFDVEEVE